MRGALLLRLYFCWQRWPGPSPVAPELGRRALEELLRFSGLRLVTGDRHLGQEMARLAADLQLRGADAAYVAVATRLSLPLVTWGREQVLWAASCIPLLAPEEDR